MLSGACLTVYSLQSIRVMGLAGHNSIYIDSLCAQTHRLPLMDIYITLLFILFHSIVLTHLCQLAEEYTVACQAEFLSHFKS